MFNVKSIPKGFELQVARTMFEFMPRMRSTAALKRGHVLSYDMILYGLKRGFTTGSELHMVPFLQLLDEDSFTVGYAII